MIVKYSRQLDSVELAGLLFTANHEAPNPEDHSKIYF